MDIKSCIRKKLPKIKSDSMRNHIRTLFSSALSWRATAVSQSVGSCRRASKDLTLAVMRKKPVGKKWHHGREYE